MANTVTFNRVHLGVFEILVNGIVSSKWQIVNGCAGLSGRDTRNIYILAKDGMPTKIQGTLQMCKKTATYFLGKEAA